MNVKADLAISMQAVKILLALLIVLVMMVNPVKVSTALTITNVEMVPMIVMEMPPVLILLAVIYANVIKDTLVVANTALT